jgi:hypothetical protein
MLEVLAARLTTSEGPRPSIVELGPGEAFHGRVLCDDLEPSRSGAMRSARQDGIDPTTSTGRLMLNMLATLAEYERELIVERVNAGIAAARQSGTRFGRPAVDPAVITSWPSSPTPARKAAPRKTPAAWSGGAAPLSTGTSRQSCRRRRPLPTMTERSLRKAPRQRH